jgi:polyisoprenoid-binding protein YceI
MTTVETFLNDPDTVGVWNLVPNRSTIAFKIKNMWGALNVKGKFTEVSGDAQLTGKGAIFGRIDLEVASLDTGIRRRDHHLLSADFFDAERFPQISVVVTAVQPGTGNRADLQAAFTIKGVTAAIPLPVKITVLDDGTVRVSASVEIDRAEFGLNWNRAGMIASAATAAAEAYFVRAE